MREMSVWQVNSVIIVILVVLWLVSSQNPSEIILDMVAFIMFVVFVVAVMMWLAVMEVDGNGTIF